MSNEKKLIAAMFVVMLAGCSEQYRQADDSILCDPVTHKAYQVTRGAGDTSFIKPAPKYAHLCVGEKHE